MMTKKEIDENDSGSKSGSFSSTESTSSETTTVSWEGRKIVSLTDLEGNIVENYVLNKTSLAYHWEDSIEISPEDKTTYKSCAKYWI